MSVMIGWPWFPLDREGRLTYLDAEQQARSLPSVSSDGCRRACVRMRVCRIGRPGILAYYRDPEGNKVELLKYLE